MPSCKAVVLLMAWISLTIGVASSRHRRRAKDRIDQTVLGENHLREDRQVWQTTGVVRRHDHPGRNATGDQ